MLYQNGEATDTREVSLKAGENRYAFSLTAQKTGVVTYEARLVSREDTQSQNNHLSAYARVLGAPNVLLVEESGTAEKLFSASGMQVERIRPIAMPSGAEGYLAYDAVILNNIEYENASQQQWQALDQAVRAWDAVCWCWAATPATLWAATGARPSKHFCRSVSTCATSSACRPCRW